MDTQNFLDFIKDVFDTDLVVDCVRIVIRAGLDRTLRRSGPTRKDR